MNEQYAGEDDELVSNSSARIPVCLCLDISGSMAKNGAIESLTGGVNKFYEAIRANERTKESCEIAIVTFNSQVVVLEDFSSIAEKKSPVFKAEGGTALAHGVNKALDLLEARKQEYKKNGVEYYQPWLVLMTDGKPGDVDDVQAAQKRCADLVGQSKLTVFSIAVGNDSDPEKCKAIEDILNGFSPKRKALHLKDLKFEEFFEWLGKSVATVSQSQVGDTVKLDTAGLEDWGTV
jgi:uncharacterized protein YegL